MYSNTNIELHKYKAKEFYNNLPESVKLYLKSHIEDIVKLGVDYINSLEIANSISWQLLELLNKNIKYSFSMRDKYKDIFTQTNNELVFIERNSLFSTGWDTALLKDPTRLLKLKPSPIK